MKRIAVLCLTIVMLITSLYAPAYASKLGTQKYTGRMDFMWPVPASNKLSGCFFDGRGHYALDIYVGHLSTKNGQRNVVASYDGVVEWVRYSNSKTGFGNSVMLKHEYVTFFGEKLTLYTHYGHLDSISVKAKDMVKKGQKIGVAGNTGYSKGPHLDFMILTQPKPNDGDRNKYSLDPYANFLLELPSDITKGGTTNCCDEYIKKIKKLYKEYITLGAPDVPLWWDGLNCSGNGIELKFYRKFHATSYQIWRKEGKSSSSSADKLIATITDTSSSDYAYYTYYDTNVSNGKWYTYTVKAVNSNGITSGYSRQIQYLTTNSFSGVYTLTPQCAPNSCLDAKDGSKKSGTNIQIWGSNGTAAQKFRFTKLGDGYYKITCEISGMALDVSGGISVSGTNVQLYTPNGSNAQQWKLVDAGGGYYYIISRLGTDMCLDVWNKGSANGTNVLIWKKNNGSSQKWKLTKVSN